MKKKVFFIFGFIVLIFSIKIFNAFNTTNDILDISSKFRANKELYIRFYNDPKNHSDILNYLILNEKLKKRLDKLGVLKDERGPYLSYYVSYERSVNYYIEDECWENITGAFSLLNLKKCS